MSTAGRSTKRSGSSKKKAKTTAKQSRTRTTKVKAIDKPFAAGVLRRARNIATGYRLIIEPESDVVYLGRTAELPYVMADGETVEECVTATVEATIAAVATLLEQGETPPSPAAAAKRDRQVNIRLTADEKGRLEEAARQAGFRSISDYLRTAGLERAS